VVSNGSVTDGGTGGVVTYMRQRAIADT